LALAAGKTRYRPAGGSPQLRQALAEKLSARNSIAASAESTIVTPGVSGGLFLAMATLLDPGDEIIIPDPYFLAYRELATLLDAKPVFVSTYPDFGLNIDRIRRHITPRTKAILINTPNNPAGSVYGEDQLKELARLCEESGLAVIVDEVYEDFIYTGRHFSIGSVYQPTITLNGFSKNHAMTGLRIGYAHCDDPAIIKAMTELAQYVFFSNSSIAEEAALAALPVRGNFHRELYTKNRDYIVEHLDPRYERSSGDGSFFFFLKHPTLDGRRAAERALRDELIVIPGDIFSQSDSHFRISYAVDHDIIKRAVAVLNTMLMD